MAVPHTSSSISALLLFLTGFFVGVADGLPVITGDPVGGFIGIAVGGFVDVGLASSFFSFDDPSFALHFLGFECHLQPSIFSQPSSSSASQVLADSLVFSDCCLDLSSPGGGGTSFSSAGPVCVPVASTLGVSIGGDLVFSVVESGSATGAATSVDTGDFVGDAVSFSSFVSVSSSFTGGAVGGFVSVGRGGTVGLFVVGFSTVELPSPSLSDSSFSDSESAVGVSAVPLSASASFLEIESVASTITSLFAFSDFADAPYSFIMRIRAHIAMRKYAFRHRRDLLNTRAAILKC